jgi:hypothetical protein
MRLYFSSFSQRFLSRICCLSFFHWLWKFDSLSDIWCSNRESRLTITWSDTHEFMGHPICDFVSRWKLLPCWSAWGKLDWNDHEIGSNEASVYYKVMLSADIKLNKALDLTDDHPVRSRNWCKQSGHWTFQLVTETRRNFSVDIL